MNLSIPFRENDPNFRIVELGGGSVPRYRPNIDIRPGPTTDLVHDLNEFPFPIPDTSFDGIYCSYMLEHVSWRKISQFIAECRRILVPGGVAYFITANLLEQAKSIIKEEWNTEDISRIFGDQNYDGGKWTANAHFCGFSPSYAMKLFREAGFSTIITIPLPWCKTDMVIEAYR